MKSKDKIITGIFCAIIICIYFIAGSYKYVDSNINKIYKVYLDGEIIGAIDDKEALYNLIDEKQQSIKDKYNVENVYPPNSLEVIETYSYNTKTTDLNTIYNKIEELQDFTIHGYEVKMSATKDHEAFNIYVLDKEIFSEAIEDFILAFIDEQSYENYINGTQRNIEDVGIIYKEMGFVENISIREKYISTNDKIYETSNELAQDLLFGFNYKEQSYTVKVGDTIESVAETFELNPQEILIANSRYSSKDSLLTIGDKLMIAYVIPEISFTYEVNEMKEVEYDFALIDIDSPRGYKAFEITPENKHYFVTSFDLYSLKRGLQVFKTIIAPIKVTKVLFTKEMLASEDEYLNYLSAGLRIKWNTDIVFFPFETGDQNVIYTNQRSSRIRIKGLSTQYMDSIMFIIEDFSGIQEKLVKKAVKILEKN